MLSPPPGDRPSRDPISSIPAALRMISSAYAWAATPPIPLAGASVDAHARPDTAGKTHQDRGSSAFVPAPAKPRLHRRLTSEAEGRLFFLSSRIMEIDGHYRQNGKNGLKDIEAHLATIELICARARQASG